MQISESGLNLIKSFEGLRLEAYKDPGGVLTIGWGSTEGVAEGLVIDEAEADRRLRADAAVAEIAVKRLVTTPLSQWQFDALTSFVFNCGQGTLARSRLLKAVNAGQFREAAELFDKHNKAKGRVLGGLTRRRAAESGLFQKGSDPSLPRALPGEALPESGLPPPPRRQPRQQPAPSRGFFAWIIEAFMGLFRRAAKPPAQILEEAPADGDPPWLIQGLKELGVKEVPGAAHNPAVLAYYREAGHPEIDNDETAWCAAFAGAMLERAGVPSSKDLAARSYLTWGKKLEKPRRGCVTVFWRGSPRSWTGHVAFWMGETAESVTVLGGNQGNAVSLAQYPKSQVLGYYWPVTGSNSRTFRASALGVLLGDGLTGIGTAIAVSPEEVFAFSETLKSLTPYWPYATAAGIIISLLTRLVIVWARSDDLEKKGR